jgi:hypothetical protein
MTLLFALEYHHLEKRKWTRKIQSLNVLRTNSMREGAVRSESFRYGVGRSGTSARNPVLFEEMNLLKLDHEHVVREAYVRAKLAGAKSILENDDFEVSCGQMSISTSRSRIASLKAQIKSVREEKKRVLTEGIGKMRDYMKQLRREHAEHAREMRQLRGEDAANGHWFIEQIEDIKREYQHRKKPLDEIIRKVRETIERSEIGQDQTISDIQVTEVDVHDSVLYDCD